jgi:hypothetical protein
LNLVPKADNADLLRSLFAFLASLDFDGSFEGLFFDWFGGRLSEDRAMNGPRGEHYAGETFAAFHDLLMAYEPAGPQKLDHPRFAESQPETLLIDEIEAIWSRIAENDDWSAFNAKLGLIETYRQILGLS